MQDIDKSKEGEECLNGRHGYENNNVGATGLHTSISIGERDRTILTYMFTNKDKRFNVRGFSNNLGIKRTTVYDALNRLLSKGLIIHEHTGSYRISDKGTTFIECLNTVGLDVGKGRRECRSESLSTHYMKYKLDIMDRSTFNPDKLILLGSVSVNRLPNFSEYYVNVVDAVIVVKLNSVFIHIKDIISDSVEEAHREAFDRALLYAGKLRELNLFTENLCMSQAHYARVESYLSQKLSKVDNRYYLLLADGSKFWIDYSDKREDETDNPLYRERVDEVFKDLQKSKSVFSDVDRHEVNISDLKELAASYLAITNNLVTLQLNGFLPEDKKKEDPFQVKLTERESYFG